MRYLIIRHKIRMALLIILLAGAFVSVIPWIYKNVFIHEEDFFVQDEPYPDYDFSSFFADTGIDRDVSLDCNFLNNDYVFSRLRIDNVNLKDVIVSANLIVKGQFIKDEDDRVIGFSGKLFSRDIVLNSNPFADARMSFKIANDELEIESLRLGKSYELKGRLSLVRPFEADLRLEIARADIRDFARFMKAKNPDAVMGVMNGAFYIKGGLFDLFSKGTLESRNGKIGPIDYNSASIRLEGFGPIINIVDSNIRHGNSTVTMDGYVDLRNIGKGGLFDGINIKSDMKRLVWDDWDITKNSTDELSMEKDISDKMRVGFKTMAREPHTTYYDKDNPEEMSLKYKIGKENLKLRLKEDEEFFGIEHSIKF